MAAKQNFICDKSFEFALSIISLHTNLQENREYVISKQLLRSSTSIGANVAESQAAASMQDFLNKMRIAKKEAFESKYWLELLAASHLIDKDFKVYIEKVDEIIRILGKITSTTSHKLSNK